MDRIQNVNSSRDGLPVVATGTASRPDDDRRIDRRNVSRVSVMTPFRHIPQEELIKFAAYCWDFYGPDGLYPIPGLKRHMVYKACRLASRSPRYGNGDSNDRETVRRLVVSHWELAFN